MSVTLERMPKPKKPPTDTTRVHAELLRRINRVAAHRGQSVPDYISERFGPLVGKDEAKMLEEIARERKDHTDA